MRKRFLKYTLFVLSVAVWPHLAIHAQTNTGIVPVAKLKAYVDYFNATDSEYVKNYVPNDKAFEWLSHNIPLFECPDTTIEKIYYYRWWAFRKHLKQTLDGFVFTEFITPVGHAGKHNTVSSGLGHHIMEGRWLRDTTYINQYINFWLYADAATPKPHLRAFSSWLQHAILNLYNVHPDTNFLRKHFKRLDEDYKQWEAEKQLQNGMFWQFDVRDAMEESISGSRTVRNMRPTINSYMYGNAMAMAKMAIHLEEYDLVNPYSQKVEALQRLVLDSLWDDKEKFFKVRHPDGKLNDAREAIGFIPWYFNLPKDKKKYAAQWKQIMDTTGFDAPWGLTTAERRHPLFRTHGSGHGCEWDGAVWPFATSQTLKGFSNFLTKYKHHAGLKADHFYYHLQKYAASHQKRGLPYLGEYQDEKNGYWLKGDNPRSSYYNHSTFADIIISDLVGLKPRPDKRLEIHPLIPADKWDWFCLDQVPYHGKLITILWDKHGTKYNKGKGLAVYLDGKKLFNVKQLRPVKYILDYPYPQNP
jgi:hypothetical protein